MERFPDALEASVAGVVGADWNWRPASAKAAAGGPKPEAWSILDVLHHLVNEEVEDFATRLRSTIEDPKRPWPKMDPEARVVEMRARGDDAAATLSEFRAERKKTVAWLRSVEGAANWDAAHLHPSGQTIHAGDLLASWAAHDARHLEQIAKRLHGLAARDGGTFEVRYAG